MKRACIVNARPLTAYSLLLTAYCSLLTASCLLLYYLLIHPSDCRCGTRLGSRGRSTSTLGLLGVILHVRFDVVVHGPRGVVVILHFRVNRVVVPAVFFHPVHGTGQTR